MTDVYVRVAETGIEPPESAPLAIRVIGEMLPKANPDFEAEYPRVRLWYLEVDSQKARVLREVGFDEKGTPIVIGPFRSNFGVWTDSPAVREWHTYERITKEEFEQQWNVFLSGHL